jgi:hypothetical protein
MLDQILAILSLVVDAITAVKSNNPAAAEQAIIKIVQAGHAAYQAQAGKPIDPSLLSTLNPIV